MTRELARQPLGVSRSIDSAVELQRLSQRLLGSRRVAERGRQAPALLEDPRRPPAASSYPISPIATVTGCADVVSAPSASVQAGSLRFRQRERRHRPEANQRGRIVPVDVPTPLHDNAYPGGPGPLYLPITLGVHLPFGFLPQRAAELAFLLMTIGLVPLIAGAALASGGVQPTVPGVLAVGALLLASRPGNMSVFLGQSTPYIVIGVYAALRWAESRPSWGGLGLAIACLKPTFGVPLGFLMLCRRQWRAFAVGAGLTAVGCVAMAPVLIDAAGGFGPLRDALVASATVPARKPEMALTTTLYRVDAASTVSHLLGDPSLSGLEAIVSLTVLLLTGVTLWHTPPSRDATEQRMADTLVCLTCVIGVYHQSYDTLLLAYPAVTLAGAQHPLQASTPPRWERNLVLALLLVPAVNYLNTRHALALVGRGGGVALAVRSSNGVALLLALLWVALRFSPRSRRRDAPNHGNADHCM